MKTLEELGLDRDFVIQTMRETFEYGEEKHPQIGIFWYDPKKDELFGVNKCDAEDCDWVTNSNGEKIKSYKLLHKNVWKKESYKGKDKRFFGNYTMTPRGRVSQYKDKGFVVMIGSWIKDYPFVKDDIIYDFELPEDVEFIIDHHWDIGNGWNEEDMFSK